MLADFDEGAQYSLEFLRSRARDLLHAEGHLCATLVTVEPVAVAARALQLAAKKVGRRSTEALPGL